VRIAAFFLAVIGLAGCSLGGDKASIEVAELEQLVLQPGDVPRNFLRFDEGRQIRGDSPGGRRADPARFGRQDGWKARYRGPAGMLVIESKADLFDSADGAEDDFEAARADLTEGELGWKPIDEPGLGDESFAATFVQPGAGTVRHYQVFWRSDNATASVTVNGFEGRLPLADVLELARKQERRMRHSD
jgi:hypothetical protein